MSNPNYSKGVMLERELVKVFRNAGYDACRSAGSHSPYDVFVWTTKYPLRDHSPYFILRAMGFLYDKYTQKFIREGTKYNDRLDFHHFTAGSEYELVVMFQCKRSKK